MEMVHVFLIILVCAIQVMLVPNVIFLFVLEHLLQTQVYVLVMDPVLEIIPVLVLLDIMEYNVTNLFQYVLESMQPIR
jgi:hypothetical protein